MKFEIKKDAPAYPHKKHWQFCVGSGHAALALRSDYVRQLKFIHDELGIERVRFHGIFNDDMNTLSDFSRVLGPIPPLDKLPLRERTFHRCGLAYDNVLAAGMKPFVELGFMPGLLARDTGRGVFDGQTNMNPPADYDKWAEHVREFVKFLIHRYGKEEVEGWYFEVWNEPDLNTVFWHGTKAEYYKLYEVTVRTIKEIDDKIRVGGPSTSGSKWVTSFVKFCRENNVPLDFVSTHQYAGDPLGGIDGTDDLEEEADNKIAEEMRARFTSGENPFARLPETMPLLDLLRFIIGDESETKDLPNDTFMRNSALIKKQAGGLPVFYTEWNFSAAFSAKSNDTRKVAAYDVKTALDIAENVTGSSIWCFSDIFEEMHQFPQEFHGGFGMQTLNGIPKPVFYGLKMLAQAGDRRIDLGENAANGEIGIAAFRKENETQVLLFRQKMKQEDLPAETVEVSVEAGSKPAKVILQRIDETHCNPLKLWENDGRPADLTPAQVRGYIERGKLTEETMDYTFADGVVKFKVSLHVNDLYFIKMAIN
jgi:xylan 1,4-beta-xylosidase